MISQSYFLAKQLGSHKVHLPDWCQLTNRWVQFSAESSTDSETYTSHWPIKHTFRNATNILLFKMGLAIPSMSHYQGKCVLNINVYSMGVPILPMRSRPLTPISLTNHKCKCGYIREENKQIDDLGTLEGKQEQRSDGNELRVGEATQLQVAFLFLPSWLSPRVDTICTGVCSKHS